MAILKTCCVCFTVESGANFVGLLSFVSAGSDVASPMFNTYASLQINSAVSLIGTVTDAHYGNSSTRFATNTAGFKNGGEKSRCQRPIWSVS